MDNKTLQILIYDQLYAASLYALLSDIAISETLKIQMETYKNDCNSNAAYLNRIYQEYNTSSYNPILKEPEYTGSFIESILTMLEYETNSYRKFYNEIYDMTNSQQVRDVMRYIAGILDGHGLGLTHIYLKNQK